MGENISITDLKKEALKIGERTVGRCTKIDKEGGVATGTIFGLLLDIVEWACGKTGSPDVVCVDNMDKIRSIGSRLIRVNDNLLYSNEEEFKHM